MGYIHSNTGQDPTLKGPTTYDPQEFQDSYGFKPPFTKDAVKRAVLRENAVFRRKTLVVKDGDAKVSKYFMYFKLGEASQ